MKRSSRMPATMDSTLPSRQPATMPSDSQSTGGGGSNPIVAISRDSAQNDPQWVNLQEKGPEWETVDKKTGEDWEVTDRKEGENNG